MASFYLLPAILEQSFINTNFIKGEHGGITETLIGGGIPLFSSDLIDYIFINQLLLVLCLSGIALMRSRQSLTQREEILRWSILALVITFLMSSLSAPIWQASPTLQKVIFAWRLLQILSFVGAVFYGILVSNIINFSKISEYIIILILGIILLTNYRYSYKMSRKFIAIRNPGRANIEHLRHIKQIITDPYTDKLRDYGGYRPTIKNANVSPPIPKIGQPHLTIINGRAEIKTEFWKSYQRKFLITAIEPSLIRMRTYYYPAWHLYINGQPAKINISSEGTVEFPLKPGEYQVELRYQLTLAYVWGMVFSLVNIVVILVLTRVGW